MIGEINMTSSMTAFGSSKKLSDSGTYYCELRSVNHRYLDINFRLPEELRPFETKFKELIGKELHRGRVDCSIKRDDNEGALEAELDANVVQNLLKMAEQVSSLSSDVKPLNTSDILRWPGVLKAPEADTSKLKEDTDVLLRSALEQMKDARNNEGIKLKELISKRVNEMNAITQAIQERLPELQKQYRQRLDEKLESVRENMDESRVEQEMVLFLNKSDVMEELDRLLVHFDEVKKTLNSDKPQGRRLDFLMQELNREVNTLGSKSQDALLTQQSVELKVLIEQMREQVQNIE